MNQLAIDMENKKKKCTSKSHQDIDANSYCQECRIYICKECEVIHSKICINHHTYDLNKDINEIFTGICKEENHSDKVKYFCQTHNVLCCAGCISRIKDEEYGQHKDCDICVIDVIKDEKKNKLKDNMKCLEDLSINLEESINKLKTIFEKINENKEALKINVQKIFTKLRNELNNREDIILTNIDQKFDNLFFKEEMIKECDKLPNKIKLSLEKGKKINNEWTNENITSSINDCINIENNITYINDINKKIKICNSYKNLNVKFAPKENELNNICEIIKNFGDLSYNNFKFKNCPENINENRKYIVTGEDNNILTKTGTNEQWMGTICENILDNLKEYIWKIKILKTNNYEIMVGVTTADFDINSSSEDNCLIYYNWNEDIIEKNYKNTKKSKKSDVLKKNYESSDEEKNMKKCNKKKDSSDSEEENMKKCNKKKDSSDSEEEDMKKCKKKKESSDSEEEDMKKCKKKKDSSDSEEENMKKCKKKKESSDVKKDIKKVKNKVKKDISEEKDKKKSNKMEESSDSEEKDMMKCIKKKERNNSEEERETIKQYKDEITILINMEKQIIKFIRKNGIENKFSNIPVDKPLSPVVFLYNTNDSIEINGH